MGHLPQDLVLDTSRRVDEALGIAAKRAALDAIALLPARPPVLLLDKPTNNLDQRTDLSSPQGPELH